MKKPIVMTRQELFEKVWSKPMSVLARDFGVTGNALAKICDRMDIPYPTRGHWARAGSGKRVERPTLPADPERDTQPISISRERARSRRARTRLLPEERRMRLIEVVADIIGREGISAATMKRIAREAGISETQAYNYFPSQTALLTELARRELRLMRVTRLAEMEGESDHYSRLALSIKGYLKHVQARGELLQILLHNGDVRLALRRDYRARRNSDMNRHAEGLVEKFGVERAVALACTTILTGVSLRTGKLVASKKIDVAAAERLCVAINVQGSRDMIAGAKERPALAAANVRLQTLQRA